MRYLPYYRYLLPVRWHFIGAVLAGLFYALASGAGIPLMVDVIFPLLFNEAAAKNEWYQVMIRSWFGDISKETLLLVSCLWIPLIFTLRSAASYANTYLIQYTGNRVLEDIRVDLFGKLQSLPLSFYKKNKSGDLLARLIGDTAILKQIIANVSSDLIKQPATLISALSYLVYKAYQNHSIFIVIIALLTIPACATIIRLAGKKLAKNAKSLQNQSGSFTAALTEGLQSPLEIRAYNLEGHQLQSFSSRVRKMFKLTMKMVKYRALIAPCIEVVAAVGFAVALYLGVREGLSQSDFMALGAALFMSYEPIKKLGAIHSQFKQADASIDRIEHVSNEPDEIIEALSPKPLHIPKREISFDQVSFAYSDDFVLRSLQLKIGIGQVVALVGPSGAGKSTFVHLIPRFYDPSQGAIRFDGIDIREFAKKSLRDCIAVVPQSPTLFMGSIADNIRMGRLDASEDEIITAARKANADEFIRAMPAGYATEVGERGDLLSGGQRQRIAIARAFLKDAPILILDEATSALDAESEAMVQAALAALVRGRTTFIIAHRFSTITIADRILVFDHGEIVADGTHQELRECSPIYQAMIRSQMIGAVV